MEAMVEMANDLSRWKRDNPKVMYEPFGDNRHTYCHLMVYHHDTWHRIEVRGFNITMDYQLIEVSGVCWTLAAGTCTVRITPENVKDFKILEDEPTLQVLYG